jgi:hypothetical protein
MATDLLGEAPRSLRPTLFVLGLIVAIGGVIMTALGVVNSAAKQAAATQVGELQTEFKTHSTAEEERWRDVQAQLAAIATNVQQESLHVAKIDQWIQDQQDDAAYAGPRHVAKR